MDILPLGLILIAAFLHAFWNFIAKDAAEPRAMLSAALWASLILYAPLFAYRFPSAEIAPGGWYFILATGVLHALYFYALGRAYGAGDLSRVYPLARGSAPILVVGIAALFLWGAGSVSHPIWLAAPIVASAYGFSRQDAKTEDGFFLGFPSYWNILAIYLWLFSVGPIGGTIWVVVLSVAVFVPMKYLYPSKVRPISLRLWLGVGGLAWTAALVACVRWPAATAPLFIMEVSLLYPAWYIWLSISRGGFAQNGFGRRKSESSV